MLDIAISISIKKKVVGKVAYAHVWFSWFNKHHIVY